MARSARHFQLRSQTLELLALVAKKNGGQVTVQIDDLIDELERVWQTGDVERLEAVRDKAKALADSL
jgi:hypothetical protein